MILVVFFVLGWALSKSDTVGRWSDSAIIGSVVAGALIDVPAKGERTLACGIAAICTAMVAGLQLHLGWPQSVGR